MNVFRVRANKKQLRCIWEHYAQSCHKKRVHKIWKAISFQWLAITLNLFLWCFNKILILTSLLKVQTVSRVTWRSSSNKCHLNIMRHVNYCHLEAESWIVLGMGEVEGRGETERGANVFRYCSIYICTMQCNVGLLLRFDSMLSTLLIIICLRLFFVFKWYKSYGQ